VPLPPIADQTSTAAAIAENATQNRSICARSSLLVLMTEKNTNDDDFYDQTRSVGVGDSVCDLLFGHLPRRWA